MRKTSKDTPKTNQKYPSFQLSCLYTLSFLHYSLLSSLMFCGVSSTPIKRKKSLMPPLKTWGWPWWAVYLPWRWSWHHKGTSSPAPASTQPRKGEGGSKYKIARRTSWLTLQNFPNLWNVCNPVVFDSSLELPSILSISGSILLHLLRHTLGNKGSI